MNKIILQNIIMYFCFIYLKIQADVLFYCSSNSFASEKHVKYVFLHSFFLKQVLYNNNELEETDKVDMIKIINQS
ncbi:hypothetical protein BpHYR1_045515 [Brachionus plicatilis]|uniref:Uncharacterized protein n=1 Tax=Brachionus plicatilis TaxID=10195 RepID=A0A3M7SG53_BRAPC|nr:hypothetical protein BpHYR1_045515 [Brachionus plicatilis]